MDDATIELIEKILFLTVPIITAILGFVGALIIENKRMKRATLMEEKRRKQVVRTLFLKAFHEIWKNFVKIIAIAKQLDKLGNPGRLMLKPAQLENQKFKELENSPLLDDKGFYIISKFSVLSEKANILNNHFLITWGDVDFYKLPGMKKYVNDEQKIFFEYSVKFALAI